jgi:CRISPR-associated protein Csb2
MTLPMTQPCQERTNVEFFVPVNDKAGPNKMMLQSCPAIGRLKQSRTFPRVWVGHAPCELHWPKADQVEDHRAALERLCRKVTRIGHSSSLVAMRLVEHPGPATGETTRLIQEEFQADQRLRSISTGTLDMLRERYGEEPRKRCEAIVDEVEALKREKKSLTGKGSRDARAELDTRLGHLEEERKTLDSRPPVRPTFGVWTGFRKVDSEPADVVDRGCFDSDLLILKKVDGPQLPLNATLAVTKALRATILSRCPEPIPGWVSGHTPDGQPLRDAGGHLALVPLPFVSHEHADGHLLGIALVFPRSVAREARGKAIGPLLVNKEGKSEPIELRLGPIGLWTLRKRDWDDENVNTLKPGTWTTLNGKPARVWASVTPVVLDRFPKARRDRADERQAWEEEVGAIVRESCLRIGLPEPEEVDVHTTSCHLGAPRAVGKRRPLRGQPGSDQADAPLGDGFPAFMARGTNAPRPQVHVWMRFANPVIGPVLLGAGRYLGYGFCKPLGDRGV